MDHTYEEVCALNLQVKELITLFKSTDDPEYLSRIFLLLEPVTRDEIRKLLSDSWLPKDLADDMSQELFFRVLDVSYSYNSVTTPSFISFWRTVVRNHLISVYSKQWRHKQETEILDKPVYHDPTSAAFLAEIRSYVLQEFVNQELIEKHVQLASRLLDERVLQLEESQTPQKDIARDFGLSQTQISHFESWIRKMILEKFSLGS